MTLKKIMIKFYLWLFKKLLNKVSEKQIHVKSLYQIIHDTYIYKLSEIDCDYQLNVERSLARSFEKTQSIKNERVLLHDVVNSIDKVEEFEGKIPENIKEIIMKATPDKIINLLRLTVKITKDDMRKRIINLKRY
jgi:hypothetical protein